MVKARLTYILIKIYYPPYLPLFFCWTKWIGPRLQKNKIKKKKVCMQYVGYEKINRKIISYMSSMKKERFF